MPSHDEDIANFDFWANNAESWLLHAHDLHLSAITLRGKLDGTGFDPTNSLERSLEILELSGLPIVAAMLQGFAIEAYLKAFHIRQGKPLAERGEIIFPIKAHQLEKIATEVGFSVSNEEKEVLHRLSLFVSSHGRYPVTMRWHQAPLKQTDGGVPHRLQWSNEDHASAEAIIGRLQQATRPA